MIGLLCLFLVLVTPPCKSKSRRNVRFGLPVQPVDATLTVLGGRMECLTIRRGYFRGFTAAEQTGTLRSLASDTTPWDSNPSRKNEIECCVDLLNPPSKADIATSRRNVRFTPKSGHVHCTRACLLWANSGHCAYSITSSARASTDGGTVRPSTPAVFMLITSL
jgi:hypothetical protein